MHQRVRVAGHSEGSPPLAPSDQRQGSDVPLRQQISGWHSLIAHVPPNMGHPPVLLATWDDAVSATHSRSSECTSRQPVEKASDHRHRVVSAPHHGAPNVLYFVHSKAGPVCNSPQQQGR